MPATGNTRCATGPLASSHSVSPSRSHVWGSVTPDDVEANVTVSSVCGEAGEKENDADGTAHADAGASSAAQTGSTSSAPRTTEREWSFRASSAFPSSVNPQIADAGSPGRN